MPYMLTQNNANQTCSNREMQHASKAREPDAGVLAQARSRALSIWLDLRGPGLRIPRNGSGECILEGTGRKALKRKSEEFCLVPRSFEFDRFWRRLPGVNSYTEVHSYTATFGLLTA